MKLWTWELDAKRSGPDHAAWLRFEEASSDALAAAMAQPVIPGFVMHRHHDTDGKPLLTWINEWRSAEFASILRGMKKNLWRYNVMEVRGPVLLIENGYGSGTPRDIATQTRVIHRLITMEEQVRLVEWKIAASDSGILLSSVAEGTAASELLDYLSGNISSPPSVI